MLGTDIQKYEPGQLSFHSLVAGRNIYLPPPKPPAHCSPTNTNLSLLAAGRGQTGPGPDLPFYFWHVWLISWGFYRLAAQIKDWYQTRVLPNYKVQAAAAALLWSLGPSEKMISWKPGELGLDPACPLRHLASHRTRKYETRFFDETREAAEERIKNNKQEPSFHRLYCLLVSVWVVLSDWTSSASLGSDISSRGVMKIAPRNSRLQDLLAFSARSELRLFVFQALYCFME